MLDSLRSDPSDAAATEAVARALHALTRSELVVLKRLAQLRARTVPGLDWEELLNEALLRALDGSRVWPREVSLVAFLAGIMRSLVDGRVTQRRRLAERTLACHAATLSASPEDELHARQCLAAINRFFADDPDVLQLLAGLADHYLGGRGRGAPPLPQHRHDAARKRLARAILRGQLDGFLP
ncbi:MAG: sigma-70 family RNA polymerase sigma factor [Proteobacteria bacterium]|nr:sigma-70 family RNA polymerase sigma factor [Pseudomonadota bacterium]